MSHVKTIVEEIAAYRISDNKNHYFLMLEDDANFDTGKCSFKEHLRRLRRDWDLFYLGYSFVNDKHKDINELIYRAGTPTRRMPIWSHKNLQKKYLKLKIYTLTSLLLTNF